MSIYTYFPNPDDADYVRVTGIDPNDIPDPSNGWFEAIVYHVGLVLLWINNIVISIIIIIYYLFLVLSLVYFFTFFFFVRTHFAFSIKPPIWRLFL